MTFRNEWRAVSCALFLRAEYPPFDFRPTAVTTAPTRAAVDRYGVSVHSYSGLLTDQQPPFSLQADRRPPAADSTR